MKGFFFQRLKIRWIRNGRHLILFMA